MDEYQIHLDLLSPGIRNEASAFAQAKQYDTECLPL
jgi:hypothetical protein